MQPRLEMCRNLTPREAMQLQESLRERVELEDRFGEIRSPLNPLLGEKGLEGKHFQVVQNAVRLSEWRLYADRGQD